MKQFTIDAQIEEVEREIETRIRVYGRWVESGKMRQSIADFHLDRMRAVLRTLKWVRHHAEKLRDIAREETGG